MAIRLIFPRIAWVLLVVGLIVAANGNASESQEKEAPREKGHVITEAQLQSHLMSFADRFVSILDTVIALFESIQPQGKSRYEVLELMTLSAHHAYIIAGESDPDVALLDMISMITLGRIFFEEEGALRYGPDIAPVLNGFRKAEADIRHVAAQVLSEAQMHNLMIVIRNWRKNNPEVKSFPLIRFSNFAADRQDSTLTKAETPDGLFESVESASETAEELRLLAERSVYMATRIPQLFGLFGDLWLSRWMNTPDVLQTRADMAVLSEETGRLAASLEKLPDQIAIEREATIDLLMASVAQERAEAIEQLISGISAERRAALAELLDIERRIEDRLPEMILQIEDQGRSLVDYTMFRLVLLMLLGFLGYIAATLAIRFIANKMAIFANRT